MKSILLFLALVIFSANAISQSPRIEKVLENGKIFKQFFYDKKARLVKVNYLGRLSTLITYDSSGRPLSIRDFEKKGLNYVDTNFIYNSTGKPLSHDRIYPGYSKEKFTYEYDASNRITKQRIDKELVKDTKKTARWEQRTYSYSGSTITMKKEETSFGGVIAYQQVFHYDDRGNIVRIVETGNNGSSPENTISAYDSHPALVMPDDWIKNVLPASKNNAGSSKWGDDRSETFTYKYNSAGYVSGYTYLYKGTDGGTTKKTEIIYFKK